MNILYERLLLIVLVLVLLIVSWCIYDSYYVYNHTLDESITVYKPGINGSVSPEDSPITEDMVAWLTIDSTNIDYPVMQAADNVKYLNTDPFGNYSLSGSIYLDNRCSPDFSDDYSLIYGHHMEYGKMFGALDDFLSETYLKSHTAGTLIIGRNAEKTCSLTVFASMRSSAKDKVIFDPGTGDIVEFIEQHASVNTHRGSLPQGSRVIALSTCAEGGSISRIVVFCYITEN